MPPLLDRFLPGTKNPLHETQGKPAPVSLIAASQFWDLRHWLGRGALITVASPGPATVWSVLCGILPLTLFPAVTVHRPTPRPIHALRSCPISTVPGLSGTRFGRYSSGSRSFAFGCCERVYAGSVAMSIFQGRKMRGRPKWRIRPFFPLTNSYCQIQSAGAIKPCPLLALLSSATLAVFTAVHRSNFLQKELGCRRAIRAIASRSGRQNIPRRALTRGAPTNCHSFSAEKPIAKRTVSSELGSNQVVSRVLAKLDAIALGVQFFFC